MLTKIPIQAMLTNKLDRPYDMKGRANPVVGNRPKPTAICKMACIAIKLEIPIASSCHI